MAECWPSNQTIADRTGLHERTVSKAIGKLQEAGLIERHSRGYGRAMLTRLLLPTHPGPEATYPGPEATNEPATRNLLQIPRAANATTPAPAPAHIAVSPPFFEIEQPKQPIPEIESLPDYSAQLQVFANSQYAPTEATETPYSASIEADPDYPTQTQTPAVVEAVSQDQAEVPATQYQAIDTANPLAPTIQGHASEADQAVAALASLPETLLADMAMIRVSKKRPAKITRTEAVMWWTEAQKCGWDMQTVITTMICHGWARFQASWVQNLPAHVQPGTPGRDAVFVPEAVQPAQPSTIARFKEVWARQRAEMLADSARRREEQMGRPARAATGGVHPS